MSSGRDLPVMGLEKAIGMFANLLVCRAQIGPDTRLCDAVAAMARGMAEGVQHQIGWPKLRRGGEPLWDALVTVQSLSASRDSSDHGQLRFHKTEGLDGVGYSLLLNVGLAQDDDSTIDCRITYNTVNISETAARAFFAVFQRALTGVMTTRADSVATIADINLFLPLHHELAYDFNNNTEYKTSSSRRCIPNNRVLDEPSAPSAPALTIVSLFCEQVRTRSCAVAVEAWDAALTFDQLDTLSTSLCQHLVDRFGLSHGHSVALLCEKSAWVVVAMLAVLRAGAACAFLSPADGLRRLRNMVVDQMCAEIIIASPAHEEKARALLHDCSNHNSKIVVLDPDSEIFRHPPRTTTSLDRSQPDHVAFVLFTSGSTGKPKGIRLAHSSLCLSVLNYTNRLGITDQTRLFQFSAYTFDVGIGDMVASLITGAVLCIPCEQDRLSDLNGAISSCRASCVILTPSVAAFLRPARLENGSLETLVFIGEVATSELYQVWYGHVRLFNAYGPAEYSVLSTVYEVRSPDDNPAIIGTAVARHCRVWLVDPGDPSRLVPVGSSGEILIEGQHVALGYLNDTRKTAQAFMSGDKAPPAIQPLLPGTRLYLTGDLARLVPHQGLIFLGRKDLQIKLRGQRIEIGEIEFHVRRRALESLRNLQRSAACVSLGGDGDHCIGVMAAVVTAKQASGEDALVTFLSLTPGSGKMLESEDGDEDKDSWVDDGFFARVKGQLSLDLPPHMILSIFLSIKLLPQTPSGKLDRNKLLQLAFESFSHEQLRPSPRAAKDLDAIQTQTQPCSALELPPLGLTRNTQQQHNQPQAVVNTLDPSQDCVRCLWAKVLKVEAASIGPDDDFFSFGGDSILAMRLAAASLEEGIRLPILTFMRFPVLSRMAAELDRSRSVGSGYDTIELQHQGASQNGNTGASSPGDATTVSVSGAQFADVQNEFPATSFQEAVLAFNMAPARGFLNYFILKLNFPPYRNGLSFSTDITPDSTILFFFYKGDRLLQRIRPLEAVRIHKLDVGHADESEQLNKMEMHVAGLIECDRNASLAWDECLTKVFIIRHQATGSTRLVIRLPHALYDGMCLSTIWNDLSSAYNDGQRPKASNSEQEYDLVQFASSVAADVPEAVQQFWHSLLRGSDTTPVVRQAHQQNIATLSQSPPSMGLMQGRHVSAVPSRNLSMPSYTPASVLKAAWAIVLAANCHPARDDIVFGHVVSCRETLTPSMQDAVGAFVNCIPVRIKLKSSAAGASGTDTVSTIQQLVHQAQAQHIADLPHHAVGLGQLVRSRSVGWKNAHFHSVVQYQNLPVSKARALSGIDSGPLQGTGIEVDSRAGAYADVWITASLLDAEATEVELRYDASVVKDELARTLLEALCTVLRSR
ncbi:nonribosomal peptide [Colletotrichum incanum]|uniref:Nonribosomal peptide n=1 Tax=Colletotrichum incanum TaxID=1573173 RepID=A0A166ZK67_COLIC|nr:nonribosomal peptide [Colletotrichum incanum]